MNDALAKLAPTKPGVTVYVITSHPNHAGRRAFTVLWYDPDFHDGVHLNRGQCFFADPREHIAKAEQAGQTVEIVNQISR